MTRRFLLSAIALLAGAVLAYPSGLQAQETNPRFGVWEIQRDAPPPSRNLMTYEPYGRSGMRITVENTNAEGETSTWGYVTLFDGEFREVTGRDGRAVMEAIFAAYASAGERRRIDLPFKTDARTPFELWGGVDD